MAHANLTLRLALTEEALTVLLCLTSMTPTLISTQTATGATNP
jgi:hypothetical protein